MAGARAKIRAKGGAGAQIISFWLGVHFPPSFRLQANRYIFWQMHNLYILSSEFFYKLYSHYETVIMPQNRAQNS